MDVKRFRDRAVSVYGEYASLELTFSAYTLLQEIQEEKPELAAREKEVFDTVLSAICTLSEKDADCAQLADSMQSIRNGIMEKMDFFTAYTDRLSVYQYVLNRMEWRFKPEKEKTIILSGAEEEDFLKKLLMWIYADKDPAIVRDKLGLVVSQIPVRMTKTKFFERIADALTLYKNGDRSALDEFLYMLKTSAMLYEPAYSGEEYREIHKIVEDLIKADFETMTPECYEEIVQRLEQAAHEIRDMTDMYYQLQRVVNDIYALSILLPYGANEGKVIRDCRPVWRSLSEKVCQDEMLIPLEGRIELYAEKKASLETAMYEIKENAGQKIKEAEQAAIFEDFLKVASLLSDSLFIDLESKKKEETADPSYVQKKTKELTDELEKKMTGMPRMVKRAVMGQVLEKLPVFLTNPESAQEYIRVNLLGCQDKAEKLAVISILTDLMN